jgi:hypothetical protein
MYHGGFGSVALCNGCSLLITLERSPDERAFAQ